MNHTKKIITTLIMISATHAGAFDLIGTTFFSPRSQSTNAARDIVGWHRYINRYTEDLYGAFAATPSYGQILRASRAARVMFGTSTLTLSGSQVPIRCSDDFLADYFGLSPEFKSTVCLHPFIRTGLIDFGGYLGWHNFYVQIHAPVVWTSWKLGIQEEVEDNGKLIPFPANYMDAGAVTPPITSFAQAMRGGTTFGDVSEGMKYGKFGCAHHKTGLSDMQIALGYNVLQRETVLDVH
ncbi:MAG: hypothetical protein NTX86_02445 [Candidatus Dependentiae bacterium]|nr:hypothetical protein [Candidatus Dependentiae bacterium]